MVVSPITEIQNALHHHELALFVGADLSRDVTGLPPRAEIAHNLARRYGLDESQPLAEIAQRVSLAGNRWAFTDFLRTALDSTGKEPFPLHLRIAEIVRGFNVPTVITTAYDDMLERAFQLVGVAVNRLVRDSDISFARVDRTVLIKLYGDLQQPDTLIITDRDHTGLLRDRDHEALLNEVRSALRRNTMLFLGYNLGDPNVRFLFDQVAESRLSRTAYAVWPGLSPADVTMWRERGIVVLEHDPLELLTSLVSLAAQPSSPSQINRSLLMMGDAQRPKQQVTLEFLDRRGEISIIWRADWMGRKHTSFTPPYDDDTLTLVIRALDAIQHPDYPHITPVFDAAEQQMLMEAGLWLNGQVPVNAFRIIGEALTRGLGSDGRAILKSIRDRAIDLRLNTNYVLRFPHEAVTIAALPWELLSDHNQPVLLSRGKITNSCERYVDVEATIPPPLPVGHLPHMLALLPRYGIGEQLVKEEREARRISWERLRDAQMVTFDEISPLTRRALNDYLRNATQQPDVIHYFGHGIYRDGEGYLLFDNPTGGKDLVSVSELESVLANVRLLVIHACQSAMFSATGGLLTGIAPSLSVVTGAVVAMQLTVSVPAATRFCEVLYDELLHRHHSLQEAVAAARQTLYFEQGRSANWYVPTLYIRSREQRPIYLLNGRTVIENRGDP